MGSTEHPKQPGWKVALRLLAVAFGLVLTLVLGYFVILIAAGEVSGGTPSPEYVRGKYLAVGAAVSCLLAPLTLMVSAPGAGLPPVVGYVPVVLFALLAPFGVLAGGSPVFGLIFAALSVLAWWLRR
jgi:hypothetical protein